MPDAKPPPGGPEFPLLTLGIRPFFLATGASGCLSRAV
jgi:hypothetical protein